MCLFIVQVGVKEAVNAMTFARLLAGKQLFYCHYEDELENKETNRKENRVEKQ